MLPNRSHLFFIVASLAWGAGCQPDKPKATLDSISGNWTVVAATRNERPTKLLNGTYFAFGSDGTMRTNLPITEMGGDWSSPVTFTNDTTLRFGRPLVDYTLKSWSDSSLELEFTTRGLPFRLMLLRSDSIPVGSAPSDSIE
jgi:hypothetical protein